MSTKLVVTLALPWVVAACAKVPPEAAGGAAELRVRNHHELAYAGPVEWVSAQPDGAYASADGSARGEVRNGVARVQVALAPSGEVELARNGEAQPARAAGPFAVRPEGGSLKLTWSERALAALDFGLLVIPGRSASRSDVVRAYAPLDITWQPAGDGSWQATVEAGGYVVSVVVKPYAGGWLDACARLARGVRPAASEPAYVALVRRVRGASPVAGRQRFNGRVLAGVTSPDEWSRDFWYTRGVDWTSWLAGGVRVVSVSGYTPHPAVLHDSAWGEGSHFWVWERAQQAGTDVLLIAEVAGPNAGQATSRYMPVQEYAPIQYGDTLTFDWRLAFADSPVAGWEESQLRAFAGYRSVTRGETAEVVDIGVPQVTFGTSYFPYSTLAENLDYFRTPGLDRETWWPFSAAQWRQWREFVPRMRSDLHIIRAMGFEIVRLHHLELLQSLPRAETLAFLDFYAATTRELGLRVMVDSEGPAEWIETLARHYADVVQRIELENEILIGGIKPADPARWSELYRAAKRGNPEAAVFLTTAGNHGQFERLRSLGVPFDRVGLHAYKHGPEWPEAFASHALSSGGYATRSGTSVVLGEFNWKELTRLSPEARRSEFRTIYGHVLGQRAIPELIQFHFNETLSVNPSISRTGVRHYETLSLDRRPKPEGLELMRLIREYGSPSAPVVAFPISIVEARLAGGAARAEYSIENRSGRAVTLMLSMRSFEGLRVRLEGDSVVSLPAGGRASGTIALALPPGASPGTYHYFLHARGAKTPLLGWGIAAHVGAPPFSDMPVLGDRVRYLEGAAAVSGIDWERPLAVVYGEDAPVLELEMAYMLGNTLQSATGRPVRISSHADLPAALSAEGTVLMVGTRQTNPLIDTPAVTDTLLGLVSVRPTRVQFAGGSAAAVQAAATDFMLRYWPRSKDASLRITGMEKGAALGNRAGVGERDPA